MKRVKCGLPLFSGLMTTVIKSPRRRRSCVKFVHLRTSHTRLTLIEWLISNPKAFFLRCFPNEGESPHASCIFGVGNHGTCHGNEPGQGGPRSYCVEPNARQTGGGRQRGSHTCRCSPRRRSCVDVRIR